MSDVFPTYWISDDPPTEIEINRWAGGDSVIHLHTGTTLDQLAKMAGIFGSTSEARKAGISGEVPHGVEAWGTKKKRFWTIRPRYNEAEAFIFVSPATEKFNYTDRML